MLPSVRVLNRATTLGWIGLGAMGNPMALNLFTKSVAAAAKSKSATLPSIVVCEPHDASIASFVDSVKEIAGAEAASRVKRVSSPMDVSNQAARVFTMLPSTPQVEAVYLGEKGLLAGLAGIQPEPLTDAIAANPWLLGDGGEQPAPTKSHSLFVDHTTLDPTAARRVAEDVHAQNEGVYMLDGPVSGGIVGAKAGSLTIMFGSGSDDASKLAVPLMQFMARPGGVIACGGNGAGVGIKVANNLVLAINQIALAEGLALGKALDIDPKLMDSIFNTSSAQSWSSKVNSPLPEVDGSPGSRGYSGGFQAKLMLKDVGLALTAAHVHSLPTPLTWAAKSVYDAVCAEGDGSMASKDFSVVYEWLNQKRAEGVEQGWKDGGGIPPVSK